MRWLVAVQAQDFAGAKWALGLRVQGATDAAIEQAFTDGSILRTHLIRPTWHFVTPADIGWLLALTAPRVHAINLFALGNALSYILVVDGQIVGTFRRTLRKDALVIETNLFTGPTEAQNQAIAMAARRFGAFLELPVVLA